MTQLNNITLLGKSISIYSLFLEKKKKKSAEFSDIFLFAVENENWFAKINHFSFSETPRKISICNMFCLACYVSLN